MLEINDGDVLVVNGVEKKVTDARSFFDGYDVTTEDDENYYIWETEDEADAGSREYWEEMAQDDPKEFIGVVGEDQVISWAFGTYGNLNDWLDDGGSDSASTWRSNPVDVIVRHWEFDESNRNDDDVPEEIEAIAYPQ